MANFLKKHIYASICLLIGLLLLGSSVWLMLRQSNATPPATEATTQHQGPIHTVPTESTILGTNPTTLPTPPNTTVPTQPSVTEPTVPDQTEPTEPTVPDQTEPTEPTAPPHIHSWTEASCTMPAICPECGLSNGEALGHRWDDGIVTKPATEAEAGEQRFTCTACQETRTQVIAPLAHIHDYSDQQIVEPTCIANGYFSYTCRCGESYTVDAIPALGHDWENATCTESAFCKRCSLQEGSALGHSWDEGVEQQPATEEADGILRFTCTSCGATMTRPIPALGHVHAHVGQTVAPTCTENGYTTYTCRCGDEYTAEETAILGHLWSSATCTEAATCSRCGIVEGEALGHDWDDGVVTKPATEETEGEKRFTCNLCGQTQTQTLPVLGHTHTYTAVATPATCTQDGHCTYTCRCGDSYTADYIEATGHDWIAATCTTAKVCRVCKVTEGVALGHRWSDGVVTTPATEEAEGTEVYTCHACSATRTQSIPKLEHVHRHAANVTAPDCTNGGYTTYVCPCGDRYVSDECPATGHQWTAATCTAAQRCSICGVEVGSVLDHTWDSGTVVKPATEETEGELVYHCTQCSAEKRQTLPVLSHSHAFQVSTITKPNCTTGGYTTYLCRCGESYISDKTSALGHQWADATCTTAKTCTVCGMTEGPTLGHRWDEGVVTKPATEETEGIRQFTCSGCQITKTQSIPKLEHVHKYASTIIRPTCTEIGYTSHVCRCGHSYRDQETPASGHDWIAATCSALARCRVCGKTEGALLEHQWDAGVVTKPATEEAEGVRQFTCTACGTTKDQAIPKLEHTHRYNATVTEPTCTEDGFTTHTCNCGHQYSDQNKPALGHHWQDATTSVPKTCSVCGATTGDPLPSIIKPAQITLLRPVASGTAVKNNKYATIDYSNTKDGYVMVKYVMDTDKQLMVQVTGATTTYTYMIVPNEWTVFPLSDGNGSYTIKVYQNVDGDRYATKLTLTTNVQLDDEFAPFLRPNQYVNYENATQTMNTAASLLTDEMSMLEKVQIIYEYVTTTITYDYNKIDTLQSGYVPDLDLVLQQKTGICFDYAAVMTAMLRTQNIPCKLVVGFADGGYHAWISVWSSETGWIDGAIYFSGTDWELLDPTFAANGADITKVEYVWKYIY